MPASDHLGASAARAPVGWPRTEESVRVLGLEGDELELVTAGNTVVVVVDGEEPKGACILDEVRLRGLIVHLNAALARIGGG